MLVAIAIGGCGGGDGDGRVSISSDTGPKGDPALVRGDRASGTQNQRIPITRSGSPVAVYRAPVRSLSDGMRMRAIANVTLTKCAITDYIPNDRDNTACQGTREYTYDPVEIETRFTLVGGGKEPDLTGPSKELGKTLTNRCTTAVHHCTIAQEEEVEVGPDLKDSSKWKWVVFEVRASSPKAGGCDRPTPRDCQVLAVETQKGTAMYWIQADSGVPRGDVPPPDREANVRSLRVLPNDGNKDKVRRVVYSVELGPGEPISSLEGQQFELAAKGRVRERLPQAPDIASYIVLADSPTSIEGRFLISDSYNPGKTGNAGGNCERSCEAQAAAAVTKVLDCDVDAGRRYVNVVSAASRKAAKPGETVEILPGGVLEITRAFPADVAADVPGARTGCDPSD